MTTLLPSHDIITTSHRGQFWPFLKCMYEEGESQNMDVAKKCASTHSMDWSTIETCTEGTEGRSLELEYANITASLQPRHQYTPWVTVNGKVPLLSIS